MTELLKFLNIIQNMNKTKFMFVQRKNIKFNHI